MKRIHILAAILWILLLLPVPAAGSQENEADLFHCDWKQATDDRLNELIGSTEEVYVRMFLDGLTEEERGEVIRRASILQNDHIEILLDEKGNEKERTVSSLYDYLYSSRFENLFTRKMISGTYYMYLQNVTRKVNLNTDQNQTMCTLHVTFYDTFTNPADDPKIAISGTSMGAISLKDAAVEGVVTFTDENGHANTIAQVAVNGIEVEKKAHSRIIGMERSDPLSDQFTNGLWGGGIKELGDNSCMDASSKNCSLFVGIGDLELKKGDKIQTYTFTTEEYAYSDWSKWSDWKVAKEASCYQEGSKYHTRTRTCTNCGQKADTQKKTNVIEQLAHKFKGASWKYEKNNKIEKGKRWRECVYSCGEEKGSSGYDKNKDWWQADYQYLQYIGYRYMDTDGNYPDGDTVHINGYYSTGDEIPGLHLEKSKELEFKASGGADSYKVEKKANKILLRFPRKQYSIVYDGNGAESGSTPSQTQICCGKAFDLNENGFTRTGHAFLGWSKAKDGDVIEKSNVKNLSYTDGDEVKLYAIWEKLYSISFWPNLTSEDMAILGKDVSGEVVQMPPVKWKSKGENITVEFEEAVIGNTRMRKLYRLLGYSLTPEVKRSEELLLSSEKPMHSFEADEDVTLYAQWDSSFAVAYMGEREGGDNCELVSRITDFYTIAPNKEERDMYRFLGWSMESEKEKQKKSERLQNQDGAWKSVILLQKAEEKLTFGKPADGFLAGDASDYKTESWFKEDMPFLNLYAVWDKYPKILAEDLYVPLLDAQSGLLTEEYLLNHAAAYDEELISEENTEGRMKNGTDASLQTSFTVMDYQEEDFTGAEGEMSLTVTYQAVDGVQNTVQKLICVFLTDTSGEEYEIGTVRFISKEYLDTIADHSIWQREEYQEKLKQALENKKTGETYTKVTPLQKALGVKPILIPGSGAWDHVKEIWKFTHEEVKEVQAYAQSAERDISSSDFLEKFGKCRQTAP